VLVSRRGRFVEGGSVFLVGGHFGVVGELAGGDAMRGCCGLCERCVWGWDWLMGGVGREIVAKSWGGQYMIVRRA